MIHPVISQVSITYKVNVSNSGLSVAAPGIRIAGNFMTLGLPLYPDWTPSDVSCAMLDEGSGIWSITIVYPQNLVGQQQQFKFVNGDWGSQEEGPQFLECGIDDGSGNINRLLEIPTQDSTFFFHWNTCGYQNPNYIWSQQLGSTLNDTGGATVIDDNGNVYVTGTFEGTVDFNPGTGIYNLTATDRDIFVQKLDANGNFVWASKFGTTGNEFAKSIDIDETGNVFVCGERVSNGWGSDIILLKLSSSGSLSWQSSGGQAGNQFAESLKYKNGYVVFTGAFEGTVDFDLGGTYNLTSAGNSDVYVAKYEAAGGAFVWAKACGGTQNETGLSVQISENDQVYVSGIFQGSVDFNPGSDINYLVTSGINDGFILRLNSNGDYIWGKQLNASGNSEVHRTSILLTGNGKILTTGSFSGNVDFHPGPSVQGINSQGQDAFIHYMDTTGVYNWVKLIKAEPGYAVQPNCITGDGFDNFYLLGAFSGPVDFDPSGTPYWLNSANGLAEVFIQKFNGAGNMLWVDGIGNGVGHSINANNYGQVSINGTFSSSVDFDGQILNSNGNSDVFTAKIGPCNNQLIIDSICEGNGYWFGDVYYTLPGQYVDLFQNLDGCDSLVTLNLTSINSNFNPLFSSNQQLFTAPPFIVQFSNNTANMNNYDFLWLWGDGTSILSNNANVFHEYLFNGLYSVTLIATNTLTGCSDSIVINDYIYCSGGINSINENYSEFVTLTPNPASDFVTISSQDARYDVYTLLDAQGRIIQEGKLKGTSTLLDLSRMASGNYLLRIGHQQTVLKLVKE